MPGDELGAGHDVVVEEQHDVARRHLEPRLAGGGDPAVRALDRPQAPVLLGQVLEELGGPVDVAVDHDDDLVRLLLQQAGHERREVLPPLERGYHDRDAAPGRAAVVATGAGPAVRVVVVVGGGA